MLNTPIYLSEPGFLADLLFIYMIHYTEPEGFQKYINNDMYDEDIAFYNEIDESFKPYDDAFFPFFYSKDDGACFSTVHFINCERFYKNYTFQDMCQEFLDVDIIKIELLHYYASDLDKEDIETIAEDLSKTAECVLSLKLPETLKLQLLAFFVSSHEVLHRFVDDMKTKEGMLRKYHRKKTPFIEKAKNMDWQTIDLKMQQLVNKPVSVLMDEQVYFSVCLIRKNFIFTKILGYEHSFLLLGFDLEKWIDYLLAGEPGFSLFDFARALSDPHRIKIFELLLETDSMNTTAIAKGVGLKLSAVLYHLDIMTKARILTFYSKGRAVYYKIQYNCLEKVADFFSRKANKKGGDAS